MRFSRIKDDLALLEQKGTVSVSDVLGCIYDLCQDVRSETGGGVEQKELGSAQILGQRLPWLGRMLLRLYARGGETLQSASLRKRLKEIEAELGQMNDDLEQQETLNRELTRQERDLETKRKALLQAHQQKTLLQQNCGRLQQELERFEQSDLVRLRETWNRLQEEQQRLNAEREETQGQIQRLNLELVEAQDQNRQLQCQRETLRQEGDQTRAAAQQLQSELEQEQKQQAACQSRLAELERELSAAKEENASLTEKKLPAVSGRLEQTRENISGARSRLQGLEEELAADRELLRALADEIVRTEELCTHQQQKKKTQEQELAKKRQALDCIQKTVLLLDEECQKLQTRVEQLNEELVQRNFDQIKSSLNAVIYEKEQLLEQYHKLELQLQSKQQEAGAQKARMEQLLAEKQACWDRAQQEQERIRQAADRVDGELDELKQQRQQMLQRLQRLAEEKQGLEEWFRQSDAQQCLAQIQRISGRVELMKEARDALVAEHRLYAAAAGMNEQERSEALSFQTDIDALAQQLARFQEEYRAVLRSFGSEV